MNSTRSVCINVGRKLCVGNAFLLKGTAFTRARLYAKSEQALRLESFAENRASGPQNHLYSTTLSELVRLAKVKTRCYSAAVGQTKATPVTANSDMPLNSTSSNDIVLETGKNAITERVPTSKFSSKIKPPKATASEENCDVDEWVVENDNTVKRVVSGKLSDGLSSESKSDTIALPVNVVDYVEPQDQAKTQQEQNAKKVKSGSRIANESQHSQQNKQSEESSQNQESHQSQQKGVNRNPDPKLLGLNQEEKYTIAYAKMALNGTIHPFDTDKAIALLLQHDMGEDKAKGVVESLRSVLIKELAAIMKKQSTSDEVEINHYKIKAQLQQLRTEMLMMRKNNQSLLASEFAATSRELDGCSQLVKDEIANLRSEITINLNNRRYNRNISIKDIEMKYHENEKKHYNMLGDCRTYLESTKLNIIRQGLLYFVATGLTLFFFVSIGSSSELLPKGATSDSDADGALTLSETLIV